ncbi:hypothetical protein Ndes2526B_g08214 [Nannochloris sp. 'desiccata']|nr:hypothetical protein KSW81_001692 [Chlorella desiccata (nom. nud.)]KAH7616118.1 putative 50S ribosomal protein L1 [Chlorella desiccata (nom. nud.)]
MLRLGCHESLPKLVAALQVRAFSAETFQFTLSREYSSATQLDEAATGGIRTIGDLPLPRFVPTQRRQRPVPIQLAEAIRQVKASKHAKFDEAIDLAINLGIDPRRGDQMVRGAVSLPHGTGKSVRICVFANDEAAEAARAAGADIVGSEDLILEIQQSGGSGLAFDKCVATPDLMPKLGKIARILGPRGLMPNPKLGTVTTNVTEAVHSLKRGRVEFRADKGAVVHAAVGRCSFDEEQVYANIGALASALLSARPKGVKGSGSGGYLLKASLSSTMGAGVPVSVASLVQAAQVSKHGAGAA